MPNEYTARTPSEFASLAEELHPEAGAPIHITLELYRPLASVQLVDSETDETFASRFSEPLYNEWVRTIRDIDLTNFASDLDPAGVQIRFILDVTRPPVRELVNPTSEARGLARITHLLGWKFRGKGSLEGTILGAPCWCSLAATEKHVFMPRGQSWPLSRASHVKTGASPASEERRCLRLAREHWDDAHWT